MKSTTISFRLSADMLERLDAKASDEGRDRTAIFRAALEAYLDAPTMTVEQRLKAVERSVSALQRQLDDAAPSELKANR